MREWRAVVGVLTFLVVTVYLGAQGSPQLQRLFEGLQSTQTTDKSAEQLLNLGKSDLKVRKYLAIHLPPMIQAGPKDQPWNNAVRLAGDLKIKEAAPALAKWIGLGPFGSLTFTREIRLDTNPPAKALAQIGDPAIPVLVGVLNHGNSHERWNAVYALNLIGSPEAKSALREHLKTESDSTMRDFIEKVLRT